MSEQSKPVIMVVDRNEGSRRVIERSLNDYYGEKFDVRSAATKDEALEEMAKMKLRDIPLGLLLAGCEIGSDDNQDLLKQAQELYPYSKSLLLAEYDEKERVAETLRRYQVDNYLLKPIQSPKDDLFPVVDDLLQDWNESFSYGSQSIRIVGYRWSASAHQLKNFLARNLVPYQWIEIDQKPDAQHLLDAAGLNQRSLPVVFFPDGSYMVTPELEELGERVGLQNQAEFRFYDLVVVGGGPAGLSAAVYGASEGLHTLLIEAEAPGGQAGQSSRIDNYLGFPNGLSGSELTRRAVAQASRFGVEILTPQEAVGVRLRNTYRIVQLADGSEVACHVLLIATGVSYIQLDAAGEERLGGAGVFYGTVITEAITCQGKEVFILGGGNSAGQAAMYLSRFANSITMLTIEESLAKTMSQYLIDQIDATENIHVRTQATITELHGEDHLEAITIRDVASGKTKRVSTEALFVYIGARPRTEWLGDLVARDEQGYILTGSDVVKAARDDRFQPLDRQPMFLESCVPGIFAAGDTRHGSVKRIASSVGEGAMAVTLIHEYLASL